MSDLSWYSVFAGMLKHQSLSFFYVCLVLYGSYVCFLGFICFVCFAWVFVLLFYVVLCTLIECSVICVFAFWFYCFYRSACIFLLFWFQVCFFRFILFCFFWLRVYTFLFYFVFFVFRLRARAAWEPLNGWPHTPTGGGLPLQWELFLFFFIFSRAVFLYFFFSFHNLPSFYLSSRAAGEPQNGWTHAWAVPTTKLLFSIHHSLLLLINYDLQLFILFQPQNGWPHICATIAVPL